MQPTPAEAAVVPEHRAVAHRSCEQRRREQLRSHVSELAQLTAFPNAKNTSGVAAAAVSAIQTLSAQLEQTRQEVSTLKEQVRQLQQQPHAAQAPQHAELMHPSASRSVGHRTAQMAYELQLFQSGVLPVLAHGGRSASQDALTQAHVRAMLFSQRTNAQERRLQLLSQSMTVSYPLPPVEYRRIFLGSGVSQMIHRANIILDCNAEFCRDLGFEHSELVGMHLAHISPAFKVRDRWHMDREPRKESRTDAGQVACAPSLFDAIDFPLTQLVRFLCVFYSVAFVRVDVPSSIAPSAPSGWPSGRRQFGQLLPHEKRRRRIQTSKHIRHLGQAVRRGGNRHRRARPASGTHSSF
jgi:PAS domain-containing protein